MWTSNKKKYFFFLCVVLLIGVICGMFFLNNIDEASKEIVLNNINGWINNLKNLHINNFLPHILILSLFLVLSSFFVGMPIYIFYIFYNGFSLGFIISSLGLIFGIKGTLYGLIYIIITKGIYVILLMLFIMFLIKIGEKVFLKVIKKADKNVREQINVLFKKAIVIFIIILINDIILYFLGGKVLNIFNFLIN